MLVNLLSNASKFSPPGSHLELSVTVEKEAIRVSIADQGPGLSSDSQADIFRRFVHLDVDSDRAKYGAGLGLSVVKAIVESQGGQVGAQNWDGGSVFWFTLCPVKEQQVDTA